MVTASQYLPPGHTPSAMCKLFKVSSSEWRLLRPRAVAAHETALDVGERQQLALFATLRKCHSTANIGMTTCNESIERVEMKVRSHQSGARTETQPVDQLEFPWDASQEGPALPGGMIRSASATIINHGKIKGCKMNHASLVHHNDQWYCLQSWYGQSLIDRKNGWRQWTTIVNDGCGE